MISPCPYNNPDVPNTADNLIACHCEMGLRAAAVSLELVGPMMDDPKNELVTLRYVRNVTITIESFNVVLLLKELQRTNPTLADSTADWIVTAAEGGDSYSEWLTDWAEEIGLDVQAISDEAVAELAAKNGGGE